VKDKRDPVKKNMDLFQKPKTFRDRKKHPSKKQQREEQAGRIDELHHPAHKPYEREKTNWTHNVMVDGLGDEDGQD